MKEYNNYVIPGTDLHVSGLRTLSENIADNGGIKEAFRVSICTSFFQRLKTWIIINKKLLKRTGLMCYNFSSI